MTNQNRQSEFESNHTSHRRYADSSSYSRSNYQRGGQQSSRQQASRSSRSSHANYAGSAYQQSAHRPHQSHQTSSRGNQHIHQQLPHNIQRPNQAMNASMHHSRTMAPAYGGASAMNRPQKSANPKAVLIMVIIIVALLAFIGIRWFANSAVSTELHDTNAAITEQQTKLDELNKSNTDLQSKIDSMQSTIDQYNKLRK